MNIIKTVLDLFSKKKSYVEVLYPNPSSDTHWFDRKKEFDSDTLTGGTLIVGDSITEGFLASFPNFFNSSLRNYGIAGDTSIGVTKRLDSILKAKPDKLIIAIGTNDIGSKMVPSKKNGYVIEGCNDISSIINSIVFNYNAIIQIMTVANPNIKIYISSILPINNTFDYTTTITPDMDNFLKTDITSVGPLLKSRSNTDVVTTNLKLFALSQTYPNVTYIDMYNKLVDQQTQQMRYDMVFDGLHLNTNGYTIWKEEIEKII